MSEASKHNHNGTYSRVEHDHDPAYFPREVCAAMHKVCGSDMKNRDIRIAKNEKEIVDIKNKITATLLAVIVTESTLLTAIFLRIF